MLHEHQNGSEWIPQPKEGKEFMFLKLSSFLTIKGLVVLFKKMNATKTKNRSNIEHAAMSYPGRARAYFVSSRTCPAKAE